MKNIKYNLCTKVNHGTEEKPVIAEILTPVQMGWNEANEEIAKREAHNGVYTVEDDGAEEQPAPLSIEERVTALENEAPAPAEYVAGTWYYRGDRVLFNDEVYTCIAPVGVVCVWSPLEYPVYWAQN